MKFCVTMGCALMGAMAFGAVQAGLESGNICGLMNVPSDAKETLIAVPWVTVGGSDATIKVANLVKTDTLSADDELYFYNGSTYYRWVLTDGKWTPTATTKKSNDGKDVTITAPGDDYTIVRGKGLWLVRNGETKGEIWLYGQHDASTVDVTPLVGSATAPAYSLIANPNTAAYDLNGKNVEGAKGDEIRLDDNKTLYTYNGTDWEKETTTTKTLGGQSRTVISKTTVGCTIPAGQGAWYVSKGGSPKITW